MCSACSGNYEISNFTGDNDLMDEIEQDERVEEERRRIEMGNMSEAMRLGLVRR